MARTRKYYLKNNYLTLRSMVKVQRRSLRYVTHRLMVMHPHTNIIDLSLKKQLFDLEVKGPGPTKVAMACDTPPYVHAPTYQISLTYLKRQKCYGTDKKILFKKQLFYLEVKGQGPTKVIMVRDTALWSCTHIRNIIDLSRYLTLKSKVKVQRRSLRCATHRLMVMHPYTKYH
jgi:hypothetical protein